MGNFLSDDNDFHWEYTEAPHAARRIEILKKYPEIKSLMKADGDRVMVLYGLALMIIQFSLAYINCHVLECMPLRIFLNCTVGSWIASAIFMQIHETGHGLIFGPNHIWKNRIYGGVLNFAIAIPMYAFFKKHHRDHHKYQGEKDVDIEYPYEFEPKYFNGPLGKYLWLIVNPSLLTYRAGSLGMSIKEAFSLKMEEKITFTITLLFDVWLLTSGRFYIISHLFLSYFVATAGHTIGFWNVASHVEFFDMEETGSYYGWINYFMLNFGYHMEHHDFPNIPSRYLPKVRKIAPEFYESYHSYDSLYTPAIKFLHDSKYGVFSRLKRDNKRHCTNRLLHG